MVGRVIYEDPKEHSMVAPDAPVVLKVEHLNAGKMVQDVSFELRKGEILGFSGRWEPDVLRQPEPCLEQIRSRAERSLLWEKMGSFVK